jgi:hypothetical protein
LSRTNRVGVHTSLLSQKPFSFLPTSDQDRMIQVQMLASSKECFCTERNTLRRGSHRVSASSRMRVLRNTSRLGGTMAVATTGRAEVTIFSAFARVWIERRVILAAQSGGSEYRIYCIRASSWQSPPFSTSVRSDDSRGNRVSVS